MEILQAKQYANIKQYILVVLHTIKYWNSPSNREFYFDNSADWNLTIPTLASLTAANHGLTVYSGINKSQITISSIQRYTPLGVVNRATTRPFSFALTNQVAARMVNFDFRNNQIFGGNFENLGANNIINIRLYTNVGLTSYYNVAITMPVAATRYKTNFNPFVVGTYGVLGTPVSIAGILHNTAAAVVTNVSAPTGTNIVAIAVTTSGTIIGGVRPIFIEAVNNTTQLTGTKLSVSLCCLKDFIDELNREYDELECQGTVSGTVLKTQKLNIKFTVQRNIELLTGLGYGNDIIEQTIDLTGAKTVLPIVTAGAVTSSTLSGTVNVTNLAFVTVDNGNDCFTLQRDYINNTSITLDKNFYFVDTVNNQLILPNALALFGSVTAYPITSQLVRVIDYFTVNNPFLTILEVQKQSVDGTQISGGLYTLELGAGKGSADDKGDTTEFDSTALLTGPNQSIRFTN